MVARKQKRGISDGVNNVLDHYNFAKGAAGFAVLRAENPAGKKCFGGSAEDWKPPFALDAEKVVDSNWKDPYETKTVLPPHTPEWAMPSDQGKFL